MTLQRACLAYCTTLEIAALDVVIALRDPSFLQFLGAEVDGLRPYRQAFMAGAAMLAGLMLRVSPGGEEYKEEEYSGFDALVDEALDYLQKSGLSSLFRELEPKAEPEDPHLEHAIATMEAEGGPAGA